MADSKLKTRVDAAQRAHPALAVAIATLLKFKDDRSSRMAATMAFWAFFSVFPLFLVFVSLLGYFLPASIKSNVLHHVAGLFPLLDPTSVGNLPCTARWLARSARPRARQDCCAREPVASTSASAGGAVP